MHVPYYTRSHRVCATVRMPKSRPRQRDPIGGPNEDCSRTPPATIGATGKEVNRMVITIVKVERIEATTRHTVEGGLA
jgi:hypothetical protein